MVAGRALVAVEGVDIFLLSLLCWCFLVVLRFGVCLVRALPFVFLVEEEGVRSASAGEEPFVAVGGCLAGVKRPRSIFFCARGLEVGFPIFLPLLGVPEGRLGSRGLGDVFFGGETSSRWVFFVMVVGIERLERGLLRTSLRGSWY